MFYGYARTFFEKKGAAYSSICCLSATATAGDPSLFLFLSLLIPKGILKLSVQYRAVRLWFAGSFQSVISLLSLPVLQYGSPYFFLPTQSFVDAGAIKYRFRVGSSISHSIMKLNMMFTAQPGYVVRFVIVFVVGVNIVDGATFNTGFLCDSALPYSVSDHTPTLHYVTIFLMPWFLMVIVTLRISFYPRHIS